MTYISSLPTADTVRADTCKQRAHRRLRARRIRRYRDERGRQRELIACAGSQGSVLVIDRNVAPRSDERLLAHLAADEPFENAQLVCRRYLEDGRLRRSCRLVTEQDARIDPLATVAPDRLEGFRAQGLTTVEGGDASYRLVPTPARMAIAQLRWSRHSREHPSNEGVPVSLREAIAQLESYEPLCTITKTALTRHREDPGVSITILRAELERVLESSIVLNRGLREAVLGRMEREGLSMSEIAIRCGRIKRDCKGNISGETSWLARRLGLLPEGGQVAPTPWVHSDVLALIARTGIGVSPREVELG